MLTEISKLATIISNTRQINETFKFRGKNIFKV